MSGEGSDCAVLCREDLLKALEPPRGSDESKHCLPVVCHTLFKGACLSQHLSLNVYKAHGAERGCAPDFVNRRCSGHEKFTLTCKNGRFL